MKKFSEGMVTFEGSAYTASLLPRKGSRVVRIHGAIHAGPWHASSELEPVAEVASALLDEGTKKHSREEFRLALEHDGAQVNFSADGRYLYFSITSTKKALSGALNLAFEALSLALLSETSCKEVIEREAATRLHETENTRLESHHALTRLLYAPGSAGYLVTSKEERAQILRLSRADILGFISSNYRGRIVIAAVGDIAPKELESLLSSHTKGWNGTPADSARSISMIESKQKPSEEFISIPGKESIDVYMGSCLRITPADPAFPALRIAVDMLGGGFSDHLMQTIRDRDGLTYATFARIYGKENQSGMHFAAWAMFGNSLYEKGMKALKKEISTFLEKGITTKRLKEKVEEIEGRMAVSFADPRSAVAHMHVGMLSVGNAADADAYVEHTRKLTAKDIQHAAEKHIRVDAISAAGSVDTTR